MWPLSTFHVGPDQSDPRCTPNPPNPYPLGGSRSVGAVARFRRVLRFSKKLSVNNHIVGLVHRNHVINEVLNKHVQRTCLMYHAACKVEFQPFNQSYSKLTFFNFFKKTAQAVDNLVSTNKRMAAQRPAGSDLHGAPANRARPILLCCSSKTLSHRAEVWSVFKWHALSIPYALHPSYPRF